jgi:hypothetical protein
MDYALCQAISRADGLFTQCQKSPTPNSAHCKACWNQFQKSGKFPYGLISTRLNVGLYEFKCGNYSPLPYSIYMKKHNLDRETVEQYAATLGITLDEQHFVEVEQPAKKKGGRKPKSAVIVVNTTNDESPDSVMDTIFGPDSNSDSDSDSDSDDSDNGLQLSNKSKKQPDSSDANSKKLTESQAVSTFNKNADKVPKVPTKKDKKSTVIADKPAEIPIETKKNKKIIFPDSDNELPIETKKNKKSKNDTHDKPEPMPKKDKKSPKNANNADTDTPVKVSGKNGEIWSLPIEEPTTTHPAPPAPAKLTYHVKKVNINGQNFLRNVDNNEVYDMDKNHVGTYFPESKTVQLFDDDDDDDDNSDDDNNDDDI